MALLNQLSNSGDAGVKETVARPDTELKDLNTLVEKRFMDGRLRASVCSPVGMGKDSKVMLQEHPFQFGRESVQRIDFEAVEVLKRIDTKLLQQLVRY